MSELQTVETQEVQDVQIERAASSPIMNVPTVDIMAMKEMPNLENAEVLQLDLSSEYWSPLNAGESKRVLFVKIEETLVQDVNDANVVISLPCAFFLEKDANGVKQVRNGSKRLVAALENVPQGIPLLITYKGKIQNKNNAFKSDNWSVKPIMIRI
ncbi:hypothetical protein [Runella salmonicolor]|uniref:Uncharacterized protein n=1 Tax=Runella salmonicolor TaxID=2950278 RepID=A0ABT1FSZ4_9BACT|nr:hypothetical protein [Runella salmonicolor]MCP1384869.1 hypothetical protein [Runella salmonicolor]